MTQLKHSPAPFKILDSANTVSASYYVLSSDGKLIAGVPAYLDDERGLANVTLFAAAPELLQLLRDYAAGKYHDPAIGLIAQFDEHVHAAIAKATGQ